MVYPAKDALILADRIESMLSRTPDERAQLGERLRGIVAQGHGVDGLMKRLVQEMSGTVASGIGQRGDA